MPSYTFAYDRAGQRLRRPRRRAARTRPGTPLVVPVRKRCGARAVELLAWAEGHQRKTLRLQHPLALNAFSMPLVHVSTEWGLSWHTVRRAELCVIERWDRTTPRQH